MDDASSQPGSAKPMHLRAWIGLLLVWLICLPPMLVKLGATDSNRTMENITVMTSQETYLRQHGSIKNNLEADPHAWLLPTRNLQPRITKPPGVVWMNLLAFTGLDSNQAGAQDFIFRGRLVAVAMYLVLVGAVYWIGLSWEGGRLAIISALAVGTMWFVQREGMTAQYDIHMAAWSALSVAGVAWAITPGSGKIRRAMGWIIAGVALGLSWYAKGPLALVVTLIPWVIFVWCRKTNWKQNVLWMIAALLIACAMIGPWYVWIVRTVPGAMKVWMTEAEAQRDKANQIYYYVVVLAMVAPWTMWLIGGLVLPWTKPVREQRRRLLAAWWWFVAIFVFFTIPGAKQQRYILPAMAAAALLIGQLWTQNQRQADRGERDEGINLLRVPHWLALAAVSVAYPLMLVLRPDINGAATWTTAVCTSVAMLAIVAMGVRWHWQWRPLAAALATAGWALAFTTLMWSAYLSLPRHANELRPYAEHVDALAGDHPLTMLWLEGQKRSINEELHLYSLRVVYGTSPENLAKRGGRFVISSEDETSKAIMHEAGYEPIYRFEQNYGLWNILWENPQKTR